MVETDADADPVDAGLAEEVGTLQPGPVGQRTPEDLLGEVVPVEPREGEPDGGAGAQDDAPQQRVGEDEGQPLPDLGPQRAALLVPVGLVVVIWALARPGSRLARPLAGPLEDYPALRPGLIALVVALTAGFLLNDSGTAIPGVAAIILAPALAALALGSSRPT